MTDIELIETIFCAGLLTIVIAGVIYEYGNKLFSANNTDKKRKIPNKNGINNYSHK
jgi:hypothetical protein